MLQILLESPECSSMLSQWIQTIKFSLRGKEQINSRYLATEQVMYWESLFLLSLLFLENGAGLIALSDTLFQ